VEFKLSLTTSLMEQQTMCAVTAESTDRSGLLMSTKLNV
jgi:hypothetical protein